MKTPYSRIKEYCENVNASELQCKILLYKYYKDYYEIVENYTKNTEKEPTDEILEGFTSTLLSETTLEGNLKLSNEEIENELKKQIKKHDQIMSFKNFSLSVLSGVIASIIFSFLLVLIFSIAQNQIKGWINDLYKSQQEIESTVKEQS